MVYKPGAAPSDEPGATSVDCDNNLGDNKILEPDEDTGERSWSVTVNLVGDKNYVRAALWTAASEYIQNVKSRRA